MIDASWFNNTFMLKIVFCLAAEIMINLQLIDLYHWIILYFHK